LSRELVGQFMEDEAQCEQGHSEQDQTEIVDPDNLEASSQ